MYLCVCLCLWCGVFIKTINYLRDFKNGNKEVKVSPNVAIVDINILRRKGWSGYGGGRIIGEKCAERANCIPKATAVSEQHLKNRTNK